MKGINRVFAKIATWIDAFSQSGISDYQLNKEIIPEYQKIKESHQLLLSKYVGAIATVSRLSFFIGQHEIKSPSEGFLRRILQLLLFKYSPLRLLYLRPLVQFFVESHIHLKLSKLSLIYKQTSFLIKRDSPEAERYSEWLKVASSECDDLQQTLSSKKVIFDFVKLMASFLFGLSLTLAGVNSFNELLKNIIQNSLSPETIAFLAFTIMSVVVIAPYIYVFWESTFFAKRTIFTEVGGEKNEKKSIYLLENNVFNLLGRGKPKEFPVDYFFQLMFLTFFVVLFWWGQIELTKVIKSETPSTIVFPCFSIFSILLTIPLLADVILPWYRRYTKGDM